ncbi:hypothetical protein ACVOMS_12215 [Bradyrhizobium guangxiense]
MMRATTEGIADRVLVIAGGKVEETMLEALEDYVKRQKKAIGERYERGRQLRRPLSY